jgi:two-component system response regulator PilR (NtrC family)
MKSQSDKLREQARKLIESAEPNLEYMFATQDGDCIHMLQMADKLATLDDTVLVTGESGIGKELVARRLHNRRSGRFIALNLSAMPENMIQSELFGHVKGSYTGAVSSRMGLLVAASKGTIFMDEIGDISPSIQTMLLRLIETRRFRRIGENEDTEFTGRFVFATNNLDSSFRDDLYHRIATFKLEIKPLRRRLGDIKLILDHYGLGFTSEEANDLWTRVCSNVYDGNYRLKGNVRELLRLAKQYKILGPAYLDFTRY